MRRQGALRRMVLAHGLRVGSMPGVWRDSTEEMEKQRACPQPRVYLSVGH